MIKTMLGKKIPATRWAMTIGLGTSLLAMGAAYAQQVSDPATSQAPETQAADRVVVTGSNIPTSEEVGASPVDTIDQATRDRTGQEDVLSVLTRSNPAIASGGGNLGQANASVGSGSTAGGSAISIHGLPTLVLLDGRRLTDSSAEAQGGGTFTNVNLFPSALVKRIEVLKDGASAIYGTEAVGGVVNVILDQEFQGFEFSGRYGFTEKSDVTNKRFSGIFGFGDDKTHMVIGAEYVEQDPLYNRDRDFSSPSFGTTTYGGVTRFNTNPGGSIYYSLNPGLNSPNDVVAPGSIALPAAAVAAAGGNPIPAAYTANGTTVSNSSTATTNGFDLSQRTNITLDQNRTNVFASADRELIGKHVVAFADFLYASNYSQSALNAQPLNTTSGFGVVIPAGSPYNPFNGTINGANAGQVTVNNRFVNVPRVFRNDNDFYRIVAGLKGEIIPNYNYEVAFNSSRDENSTKNPGLIILSNLNQAIAGGFNAAGAPVAGGAFSMVNGNLQPALDFFARNPAAGSTNGISGDNIRYLESKFSGVDGKITAFPVNLPAGPIGFALGGEYRHETIKAQDSPEVFVGAVPIGEIDTGRYVQAGFAEIQIPIISPDMKVPGVYRLDLNGAGRFENYSTTGNTWVPKVGFTLSPIKDIALRGTYSKSFIAPTLYQTDGPSSQGFTSSFNIGGGSEQAQVLSGSNPNLGNTRADNYTAGIVISPHQVEGLTLNADFFHIEEEGITGAVDPVAAIGSVNTLGPASPFSGLVHIGSFGGPGVTAPGQLVGNGSNTYVVTNEANLGRQRIGGIDFGAHYTRDFGAFGQGMVGIDGTYYLQYKTSVLLNSQSYDLIGLYTSDGNAVEQYHLTPQIAYRIQGFSAEAIMNYSPSLRDAHDIGLQGLDPTPGSGGVNTSKPGSIQAALGQDYLSKIRDYYTIDLLFSYEFHFNQPTAVAPPAPKDGKDGKGGGGKEMASSKPMSMGTDSPLKLLDGLKLQFGITNVTNARPPFIADSPDATNTDATLYDAYQRQYYFVITKKF